MSDLPDEALRNIYRILGPNAPSCCEGCQAEISEALLAIKRSGVDVSDIDARLQRRQEKAQHPDWKEYP